MWIGVMSGTSLDGVDVVLTEFPLKLIAQSHFGYPQDIYQVLQNLNVNNTADFKDIAILDIKLGKFFAECVLQTLNTTQITPQQIAAIGLHGQTIYHLPSGESPYSLQIGNPNQVAFLTGITTVADFRNKDIAAGGQGAPLVPAFHQAIFGNKNILVVNIGGIANITYLPINSDVIGFDTGPGNCLLDSWIQNQQQQPYDENGNWAESGQVQTVLLDAMLQDKYFHLNYPKSTGREYFNLTWLDKFMIASYKAVDVQATLSELTATSIADTITLFKPEQVLACGGGAYNLDLIARLQQLSSVTISTNLQGLTPESIEPLAFAWLAQQTINKQPSNIKSVTGASKELILGAVYY